VKFEKQSPGQLMESPQPVAGRLAVCRPQPLWSSAPVPDGDARFAQGSGAFLTKRQFYRRVGLIADMAAFVPESVCSVN